jgi:SAM-dependent methyltransferase
MALFNVQIERKTIDRLNLAGDEHALEIGFGPGVGLRLLSQRLPRGWVAGIDPSEVMHQQAHRRTRSAIESGRMDLRVGTASSLPWAESSFDAVTSVNNVQLWEFERDLREVHRVLKEQGRLAVSLYWWIAPRPIHRFPMYLAGLLERVGFLDVDAWKSWAGAGPAFFFTARKSDA